MKFVVSLTPDEVDLLLTALQSYMYCSCQSYDSGACDIDVLLSMLRSSFALESDLVNLLKRHDLK